MVSLIVFIFILLVLVLVHELGHFIFAKLYGVYCVNFSLGMGPELLSKQGKETKYSLRALPIGGYVQMVGEEDIELEGVPFERTIPGIKQWQKLVIFVAGAAMNFVLAFLIFSYLAAVVPTPVSNDAYAGPISESSPASDAGLVQGDHFLTLQIDDNIYDISDVTVLRQTIAQYATTQNTYKFTVLRDQKEVELTMKSQFDEEQERYLLGFTTTGEFQQLPFGIQTFTYAARHTVSESLTIFQNVKSIFTGDVSVSQLSGPVGIYQVTDDIVATQNINNVLLWMAILSVNFGVINLLPIPALDGGRITIVLAEMITRKKLNQEIENRIHIAGFMFLMGLIVFVMINDVLKIVG